MSAVETMASSTSKPIVLLLCLAKQPYFEEMYAHMLAALHARATLVEACTEEEAVIRLSKPSNLTAVLVTDAAVTSSKHKKTLDSLVQYAKTGGGTVVYGCMFSSFVRPNDMDSMFQNAWGLRWIKDEYERCNYRMTRQEIPGLSKYGMAPEYSMKAVQLAGPDLNSSNVVYDGCEDPDNAPVAFATVGKGYVGYIGDVNAEEETTAVVLALCHLNRSDPLASQSQPTIVVLALLKETYLDHLFQPMITCISAQASVQRVDCVNQAKELLAKPAPERPSAVLVIDAAICDDEYHGVLEALIDFAKQGGTVVLSGNFGNNFPWPKTRSVFFEQWGLGWEPASYTSTDVVLASIDTVPGIDTRGLASSYNVKALYLSNVDPCARVYTPRFSQVHLDTSQTPVAFTRIKEGYLGYTGDVNAGDATTKVVLRMLRLSLDGFDDIVANAREGAHGSTTCKRHPSPPAANVHDQAALGPSQIQPSAQASKLQVDNMKSRAKPTVVVLALMQEDYLNDLFGWMMNAIAKHATVIRVESASKAKQLITAPVSERPDAIYAIDAGVSKAKSNKLLKHLITYCKEGGTVVLGGNFTNHFSLGEEGTKFFAKWGVAWEPGSYHRTTVYLNPNGIQGLDTRGLEPSFSIKALYLANVDPNARVYSPSAQSRMQSHVFAPASVDTAQTPAAFTRLGEGYLGYVGDVNAEDAATKVILRMLHLSLEGIGENTYDSVVGWTISPDGSMVPLRASEAGHVHGPDCNPENHVFSLAQGTPGHLSMPAPASSAQQSRPVGGPSASSGSSRPRRPREAEVEARAEKRQAVLKRKNAEGAKLKEQGNELYKKGDWAGAIAAYRKAVQMDGPRPVYLTNMAAAYLKQENYVLTERCTDKTLLHEPRLLKARYRRGIARKGLGMVKGAMRDFELCLEQDPKCMEAKHELADARKLFESGDYDSESDPEDPIYDSELGYTSDSSDFRHEGNGTPCKFYNHNGCKKGAKKCPFKHGPDNRSMRDDLGRNVCLFYLLGDCKFDDEDCFYAHSKLYLPPSGWWNKPEKIEQYLEMLDMAYEFSGTTPGQMMDGFLGRMLNGDLRDNGKKFIESLDDETNFTDLGPSPDMSRNKPRKKGGKPKKGKGKGVRPRDPSLEREVEERQRNCGFTDDEVYELALQGVKPWDDDAWDVLDVLNGNF